jgi:hypothetical protein
MNENPHDLMRAAVQQARPTMNAADNAANSMAELLDGRLKYVSCYHLAKLKKQLRSFNIHTQRWTNQLTNMSTKTKTKKLPKGFPKLPPVPAGWDAWELCGWGGLTGRPVGRPFGHIEKGQASWVTWTSPACVSSGFQHRFYIRAIKHPAPKPAAKGRKAVKAIALHCEDGKKFATINVSDEAALIEQAGNAIYHDRDNTGSNHQSQARAVLVSLGLIAKRRK